MRQPLRTNTRRQATLDAASVPPPVGGWDAISALADMPEDRAITLDNWFPSTGDVRVRRGFASHGTSLGSGVVESILIYNGLTSAASQMFAAANSQIYDISIAGAGSSVLSGLANNRWQYTNFTTSAGKYLWICNGADDPRHYNGSAWATPSITGVTGADIVQVNAHKHRLWFAFKDSTKAGYLATGAISGAVTTFELGSLFTKGGYLNAMATWTRDGGAGEDDFAVFISSRGQCAIYAGTDPASATTWELVGVFDLGAPIGRRCFTKVAGDVAVVNIDGVLPLSRALETDRGAAPSIAITANINNAMNEAARSAASNYGWELCPYPKGTYVLLNVPTIEGVTQHQYVMNTLTGAWCRFTNQNANCWGVFRDALYFGGNAGVVYKADTGGLDAASTITAIGQGAYNYYKPHGGLKRWTMVQPLITTDSNARPAIGMSTDFKDNAVIGTPTAAATDSALYDTAIYDTDIYATDSRSIAEWTTIAGIGQCASIHFRSSTETAGDVIMRLNGFNVGYQRGGLF